MDDIDFGIFEGKTGFTFSDKALLIKAFTHRSYLNEHAMDMEQFPIEAKNIAVVIELIENDQISHSMAVQKLFPLMMDSPNTNPLDLANEHDLIHDKNEDAVHGFVQSVLEQNPGEVDRYRGGEKKLIGFFMGKLMKISNGKIEPKTASMALRNELEN